MDKRTSISHRSDECTGLWELQGTTWAGTPTPDSRIVCSMCGAGFAYGRTRYLDMMKENTFAYLGMVAADRGAVLLKKEREKFE